MSTYKIYDDIVANTNSIQVNQNKNLANIKTSIADRHIYKSDDTRDANVESYDISKYEYIKDTTSNKNGVNYFTYDTCYRINYMINNGLKMPYLSNSHEKNIDPVITKSTFYLFSFDDFVNNISFNE